MSVPTVTSITPAKAFVSGGDFVRIVGTNFQTGFTLPASGPVPVQPPSVRVKFGTKASPRVAVLSATTLLAQVPQHAAGKVDVVVSNIDEAGAVIPNETITVAEGFEYFRRDLSSKARESIILRVSRALLRLVGEQFLANVSMTTDVDYDADPYDAKNIVTLAGTPAVIINVPSLILDRFYQTSERRFSGPDISGIVRELPLQRVRTLQYPLTVYSESTVELQRLMVSLSAVFEQNTYLEVPDAVGTGVKRFPMFFQDGQDPHNTTVANSNNMRQFTAAIEVRRVVIEEETDALDGYEQTRTAEVTAVLDDQSTPENELDPSIYGKDPRPNISITVVQKEPT